MSFGKTRPELNRNVQSLVPRHTWESSKPKKVVIVQTVNSWDPTGHTTTFNFGGNPGMLEEAGSYELHAHLMSTKADDSNIVLADNISLKEGASGVFYDTVSFQIGNTGVYNGNQYSLTNHVMNRYLTKTSDRESGVYLDSQISYDNFIGSTVTRNTSDTYGEQIFDGKTYILKTKLKGVPFMNVGDSSLPSLITKILEVNIASTLGHLYISPTPIDQPKTYVKQIDLVYKSGKLTEDEARDIQGSLLTGIPMLGKRWEAVSLAPNITPATQVYTSGTDVALKFAPDIILGFMLDKSKFSPAKPWETSYRYSSEYSTLNDWSYTSGGEDLIVYHRLKDIGQKVELLQELEGINSMKVPPVKTVYVLNGPLSVVPYIKKPDDLNVGTPLYPATIAVNANFLTGPSKDYQVWLVIGAHLMYKVTIDGAKLMTAEEIAGLTERPALEPVLEPVLE